MRTHPRGLTKLTATLAVAAMSFGLAACGGNDSGGGGDSNTVTIWSSIDQPVQDGLKKALEAKLKDQNPDIKIDWQKVENINQLIITRIQAGDTPDIALIPQPGVVKQMVQLGAAKPMEGFLDMTALQGNMLPGSLDAGTVDGKLYGLLVSANVKGLIFYPKKAWDAKGYTTPTSIPELEQLTDQIKADGGAPWCMGIQDSGGATGWPATDWFETLMMKYNGADGYNKWVSHEIPFDSDQVRAAADEFNKLLFPDGNTIGGQEAIASTDWSTASNPMWADPPKCWMLNQGSFITGFFPKNVTSDLDANVGVFGFPPATAGGDNPVEGGGDMLTVLNDSPQIQQVVKDLSETDIGNDAAPVSSFISPHSDFDASLYPTELTRAVAAVATSATAFLFDASDQMPAAVGSGTFWTEISAWIGGQEDLDTALKNIDDSWPSS
jgi:alpha-glucoside transport system substrate-binding protein